jgi:hypothetical protein
MALSPAQRKRFFERGVLKLPSALPEVEANRMAVSIWTVLHEKHSIRREDPSTWTVRQPTGFQSLTRTGTFNAMASPAVVEALEDLFGATGWDSTKNWGAPLITFPETERAWDVPNNQWHLDFSANGNPTEFPGVRVLALIELVEPGCGATVVAEGTHRLVERLFVTGCQKNSRIVRDALGECDPWLRELWAGSQPDRVQSFVVKGKCIDGIDIRVGELSGAAGDVVLMHPWTFHAPAPNCGTVPRLMVAHSVYRKGQLRSDG